MRRRAEDSFSYGSLPPALFEMLVAQPHQFEERCFEARSADILFQAQHGRARPWGEFCNI